MAPSFFKVESIKMKTQPSQPSPSASAEFVPEKINIGGNITRRGRRRGNTSSEARGGSDEHNSSQPSQTSAISSSVVFHEENVELFDEIDELYPHDYEGGKLVSDPAASFATSFSRSDTNGSSLNTSSIGPNRRPRSDSNLSASRSTLASSLLHSLQESARMSGLTDHPNLPTDIDSLMASSTDGTLAEIIAGIEDRYKSSTTMSQASRERVAHSPNQNNSTSNASPTMKSGSKRESIVGGKQISEMTFEEQHELLAPERSDRSLVVDMEGDNGEAAMLDSSEKSMCYYSPTIQSSNEKDAENIIVSSVDWSSLSKSCKRARDAFRDADSGQMVVKNMFLTHLGALTTVLTLYAKRYCTIKDIERETESGAGDDDRNSLFTLDEIKARTRETKRALRFAISCLAPPRVQEEALPNNEGDSSIPDGVEKYRVARKYRQELQEAAVKGFPSRASSPTSGEKGKESRHYYGLQIPLCEIIHASDDGGPLCQSSSDDSRDAAIIASIQREKRTVRVLAARMLCNLVTDNPLAAEIVLKDVPFSPDPELLEKRLSSLILGSRERAEQEENKGEGGGSGGADILYWSDLLASTARVQPTENVRDNNVKVINKRDNDISEDREALAATAAALHNLLTSLESRESLLELDDEMRRRELVKQEQHRRVQDASGSRHDSLSQISDIEVQSNTMKPIDVGFEVASNAPLLYALLRNILPAKAVLMQSKLEKEQMEASASSRPQFKPPASATENMSDSATEWISLVLERLASRGLLPNMLRTSAGAKSNAVTPEQVVLVSCIRQAVDDYHSALTPSGESGEFGRRRLSMDAKSAGMTVTTRPHPLWGRAEVGTSNGARTMPSRDSRTAVPVLLTLANEAEEIRLRAKALREGKSSEMYDGEESCAVRMIDDLCDILAQSLGRHAADNRPDKQCFLADARSVLGRETGLVASCCIDLGRILDAALARNAGKKAREMRLSAQDQRTAIVMVRLVGNLVYQCRYNQDLLRITPVPMPEMSQNMTRPSSNLNNTEVAPIERTGLHVILSATSLAPACFTLREWCIVAIRNAVEGNAANAETIRRLEANQALGDTPELQRMGVKIDMDERGNVSVKRRDS